MARCKAEVLLNVYIANLKCGSGKRYVVTPWNGR